MAAEAPPKIKLWGKTVVRTFRVKVSQFPDFEGTVRPMTPGEAAEFRRRIGEGASKPNFDEVAASAKVYAEHIKTWNVDAPISPESIADLPGPIHGELWGVVMGFAAGDIVGNSEGSSGS